MRPRRLVRCPTLALVLALAAARCAAPPSGGAGDAPDADAARAAFADTPVAFDVPASDSREDDGSGQPSADAPIDSADAGDSLYAPGHPQCDPCLRARCADWPSALACLDDPLCLDVVHCWNGCSDEACALACLARDPSRMAAAQELEGCAVSRCELACVAPVPTDAGISCQRLGAACDPFVPSIATCCEGSCPPSGDWYCCHPAGGACTADNHCCPPAMCNRDAMRCEVPTCTPTGEDCRVFGGLACCDSRLQCSAVDAGLATPHCCAPNGAVLPRADSTLCCSLSAMDNDNGTVTCVPHP